MKTSRRPLLEPIRNPSYVIEARQEERDIHDLQRARAVIRRMLPPVTKRAAPMLTPTAGVCICEDFETDLSAWSIGTAHDATAALSSEHAHGGAQSLKVVIPDPSGGLDFANADRVYDVSAFGDLLSLTFWMYSADFSVLTGGGSGCFDIQMDGDHFFKLTYNGSQVTIGESGEVATGQALIDNQWNEVIFTCNRSTGAYVSCAVNGVSTDTSAAVPDSGSEPGSFDLNFRFFAATLYLDDVCVCEAS